MPSLSRVSLVIAALAATFFAIVQRRLAVDGIGREVVPLNNEQCYDIPGLEACEDAWADNASGKAYLVCSDHYSRIAWVPAIPHLNASALPQLSTDYLALLDIPSRSFSKIRLTDLPDEAQGIWVHGLDVFRSPSSPSRLTLFINSHRPPSDRALSAETGAESVIEVFETELGSEEARWVRTIEHELVRTPNNMAAVSETGVYITNDHRYKVHWSRKWEKWYSVPSDIVYCDFSSPTTHCKVAADNVVYPNGITKGAGDTLYSASTLGAHVKVWSINADDTLSLVQTLSLARPFDNLHYDAPTNTVYAMALAKMLDFGEVGKTGGLSGATSAVEVWRVRKAEGAERKGGKKYTAELAFADTGAIVSASTAAAPYRDSLLFAGLFADKAVVCKIKRAG
ncbi:hypothetical protein JCM10207_004393 [Rhodosporidiobolus poonsookiae]